MKEAFTLIELLVVVLIIGILSAVALPQYQKAVMKSRAAGAIILVRAVKDAQERYYLANNQYTTAAADLDIDYQCPKNFNCFLTTGGAFSAKYEDDSYEITAGYNHRAEYYAVLSGKLYCTAFTNQGESLCKTFSATLLDYTGDSYHRYEIK